MPYYLTASNVSGMAMRVTEIMALLPEKENVPGRSPETENDLSKWTMEELSQELFMQSVQHPAEKEILDGGSGTIEPMSPEAAELCKPYMQELGRRCQEYLKNPEYSAEKRPALNAYLRESAMEAQMADAGIDFDRIIHQNSTAGHYASRQLMDTISPNTKGMNEQQRRETLDAYEQKIKEGPFFDLIHKGLDHTQTAGEYQIALQDKEHPMTEESRKAFETKLKDQLAQLQQGIGKAMDCLNSDEFKLEDYPYMNKKTVENLKETRGLPASNKRAVRENAMLEAGERVEDYTQVFGVSALYDIVKADMAKDNVLTDPGLQTNADIADWMAKFQMAGSITDGLDKDPQGLKKLKEDLKKEGISLHAYTLALQDELRDGAKQILAKDGLTDAEKDVFEAAQKDFAQTGIRDPKVTPEEAEKARNYVKDHSAAITKKAMEGRMEDLALDEEVKQNGYGMPRDWSAPENTSELLTDNDITDLIGASVKMTGVLQDPKKGTKYMEFSSVAGMSGLGDKNAYNYFGKLGNMQAQAFQDTAERELDEGGVEIVHPNREMKKMLADMNRDVREKKQQVPEANKLQHAMLNYVESFSREALEQKEPGTNRGKDAMGKFANSLWANITEPGTGKNVNWAEAEKINQQFGLGTLMQDCVSLHEIFRANAQRDGAGQVDPAKEQKERELYGKLLDRVSKTADKIINTPEEKRGEITGLFDSTNAGNAALDIFGDRGVGVAKNTAEGYKRGLEHGWPISELPVYTALEHFAEQCKRGHDLAGAEDNSDSTLNGLRRGYEALQKSLDKDISGMNDKEKSDFFRELSNQAANLEESRKKMAEYGKTGKLSPEIKKIFDSDAVSTGYGGGNAVKTEGLEDILTGVAQNSMKRAVTQGQAQPQELAGLMTKAQKNALEDATLMMNRSGDAYNHATRRQYDYQQMLEELKSLKKEGKSNSDYFDNMEKALQTLSGMNGKNSPKDLVSAYDTLQEAAQTYYDERGGLFSSWRDNGKKRRDLAGRLAEQARADKEAMQGFMNQSDPLSKNDGMTQYQKDVVDLRNEQRGKLNPNESLESQMVRYNDIVAKNTPQKSENTKQRKRVEGGLQGLMDKTEDVRQNRRNSVREPQKRPKIEHVKHGENDVMNNNKAVSPRRK